MSVTSQKLYKFVVTSIVIYFSTTIFFWIGAICKREDKISRRIFITPREWQTPKFAEGELKTGSLGDKNYQKVPANHTTYYLKSSANLEVKFHQKFADHKKALQLYGVNC